LMPRSHDQARPHVGHHGEKSDQSCRAPEHSADSSKRIRDSEWELPLILQVMQWFCKNDFARNCRNRKKPESAVSHRRDIGHGSGFP
jgi:hypothetical protein